MVVVTLKRSASTNGGGAAGDSKSRRSVASSQDGGDALPYEMDDVDDDDEDAQGDFDDDPGQNGVLAASSQPEPPSRRRGPIADTPDEDEDDEDEDVKPARAQRNGARTKGGDDDESDFAPTSAPAGPVDSDEDDEDEVRVKPARRVATTTSSGRHTTRPLYYDPEDSDSDAGQPGASRRKRNSDSAGASARAGLRRGLRRKGDDFVVPDEDFDDNEESDGEYGAAKRRSKRTLERQQRLSSAQASRLRSRRENASWAHGSSKPRGRPTRNSARASTGRDADDDFELEPEDAALDEQMELEAEGEGLEFDSEANASDSDEQEPRKYTLRKRQENVNYVLPTLDSVNSLARDSASRADKGKRRAGASIYDGLPYSMTGAQYDQLGLSGMRPGAGGAGSDSSDDEGRNKFTSPRKAALFSSAAVASALGAGASGVLAGGAGIGSGGPSNHGKLGTAGLADTDPLGVPTTLSFDQVGGLNSHIQQLKEMVSLPLLYPEVFQRFSITPPRGVLFHGPPGTGKTLLARALASACSTEGQKISFFMRKGADCLSKWVGEAERQLRLLFEEARASQPSIIFFDEIDGLAPVRSSKQEQIHASIVSTLLALMDGMDGRGQVVVIGATNRPDAVDPALRRPGRFDREFYFGLPDLEARRKIIDIHTSGWDPPLEDTFKDELAGMTKGYGGADLRALCTEAALNAVQRSYPQIYKSTDRLLIKPENIKVTARDFVVSQKNLIPSTARSTSSSAASLPEHLVPLLSEAVDKSKAVLRQTLPDIKKPNVLEEAEYEDTQNSFEHAKMMTAFEKARVFRPRMLIYGAKDLGQRYVASAIVHHLEGYHVQALDLATLVSDSTRSMEAACVQIFVEAKRHKPAILFIPAIQSWVSAVSESVISTVNGLLDGLDPSDAVLLLGVFEGENWMDVPPMVRSWFGFVGKTRVKLGMPTDEQRRSFFASVSDNIQLPPSDFPDAMPKRKRKLEKLPIAPPPPPRAPTAAELEAQEQNDARLLEYVKWRLGPIHGELKKRYKRFTRSYFADWAEEDQRVRAQQQKNEQIVSGLGDENPYYKIDLDRMAIDLYHGAYFTPRDFLLDIGRIHRNAELDGDVEGLIKAGQMVNHTKVMIDQTFDQPFCSDCDKMAERMRERIKARKSFKGKEKATEGPAEGVAESGAIEAPAEDRSLKRIREVDEDEVDHPMKRARSTQPEVVPNGTHEASTSHSALDPFAAPPPADVIDIDGAVDESVAHDAVPAPPPPPAPQASTSTAVAVFGSGAPEAERAQTPTPNGAPPVAPAIAPPSPSASASSSASEEVEEPVHHEFVLNKKMLDDFAKRLCKVTAGFNVSQLEQVRAVCFDTIWQHRKEWDRDDLVVELASTVEAVAADLKAAEAAEAAESED